jgi:hypothetical protein
LFVFYTKNTRSLLLQAMETFIPTSTAKFRSIVGSSVRPDAFSLSKRSKLYYCPFGKIKRIHSSNFIQALETLWNVMLQ